MKIKALKIIFRIALLAVVVFSNYKFPATNYSSASVLYTGSAQQTVYQGRSFIIEWFLDTQDKEINTVQLKLKYDTDVLEVLGTSIGNSLLNVWVKPPSFDNETGEIELIGGVSGGIKSGKLPIFSATFNAKQTGTAQVIMEESSAVLISDGLGTQTPLIFHQLGFTVYPADAIPATISSTTHPDPNQWYTDNRAEFSFQPKEGEQYSYSFSSNLEIFPDEVPDPPQAAYVYENLPDGIYYFKLNSKIGAGNWVEAGVYRIQIDTTPPEQFSPALAKDESVFDGQSFISFATADKVSGISHYEVKFGLFGHWEKTETTFLKLPGVVLGDKIEVKAVDAAGNEQVSAIQVDPQHLTPWFKSWLFWAIIISVVFVIYLVYKIYRYFARKYGIQ